MNRLICLISYAEISQLSAIPISAAVRRGPPRSAAVRRGTHFTHSPKKLCYLIERKSLKISCQAGTSHFDSVIHVLILTVNDSIALKYCLEISDNYSTP
jgi:hypothetical protein